MLEYKCHLDDRLKVVLEYKCHQDDRLRHINSQFLTLGYFMFNCCIKVQINHFRVFAVRVYII